MHDRTVSGLHSGFLGVIAMTVMLGQPTTAQAGIEACGNVRLEDAVDCEVRGDVECSAGCSELGVYKKACATKLHTVCRTDCVIEEDPNCTDECTEQCSQDCDDGLNVICLHNCFGECVGSCDASCEGAEDVEQCRATCEATCDGECDIRCKPLENGSCYEHCIECCGGSCRAQANMDCQTSCQEEQFESCELEVRADCDASCSGEGALFCDGEYILSGEELPACGQALLERNIADLELDGNNVDLSEVDLEDIEDALEDNNDNAGSNNGGSSGCQLGPSASSDLRAPFVLFVAFALGLGVRRRRLGCFARVKQGAHWQSNID